MNMHFRYDARATLRYAAMTIVPVLLFCLPLLLRNYYGPYFLGTNSDPDYPYLLNSLNIINAISPGHTDHPGTTVQLLGAAGLLLKWLGHLATGGHLGVNEFVLTNPEESLAAINLLINVLIFPAVIFASLGIYRIMHGIGPVLVFQISLLVPLQIKLSLFRVDPEPLLLFSVLLLSGLLFRYQKSGIDAPYWFKIPILAGIIMGFGLATKITFLPLLLLVAFFPANKERLLVVCGCITSFFLFTLPIISKFPKMFSWFRSLVIHSENYGKGEVGIKPAADLMVNLLGLIQKEPFLFIFMACYLCYLAVRKFSAQRVVADSNDKLLLLGAGVIIIQVIMTVKHPGVHYMLPAIVLTAVLNAVLVDSLKQYPRIFWARLGPGLFYTVIVAGMAHGLYATRSWAIEADKILTSEIALSNRINSMNCSTITYYGASSIENALSFGNEYSGFSFGKELEILYPDGLFFNIWSGMFYSYQQSINSSRINDLLTKNRCFILVGTPLGEDRRFNLILTPLEESSRIAAYKLEGFKF